MFSKKATKIDEIFTVDLTLYSKCQIDGEDFVNFCGLLRKYELYHSTLVEGNCHISWLIKPSNSDVVISAVFCGPMPKKGKYFSYLLISRIELPQRSREGREYNIIINLGKYSCLLIDLDMQE